MTALPSVAGVGSEPWAPRRVLVAYGTRPEIVKLAPVVRTLRTAGHDVRVVNTSQHTSIEMSHRLAREVELVADANHLLPDQSTVRLGAIVEGAAREIDPERTDVVLCLGDTETIPAYALAARRAGVPFWHLEAGLRSFNERSVEELNRRFAAAAASFNLAPTERARGFLLAEGVADERIAVVGNPIVDALVERGLTKVDLEDRSGVLLTAHRATNVDDPVRLARVVEIANGLSEMFGAVRFPVHPRTSVMLERAGLARRFAQAVIQSGPLLPGDFVEALRWCSLAVTDSGGVQEEAAFFGIPVVVLRGSTPRWEGVDNGSVALVNLENPDAVAVVLERAGHFARREERVRIDAIECPYGDGRTSERVAALLGHPPGPALLQLSEPGTMVPAELS